MSHRWIVLQLEAPLMSFGAVAVDQVGPVRDFPAASMLTGLIGNALGWRWSDGIKLQALQDGLIFAVRRDRTGDFLTDNQNARLSPKDRSWTTDGRPEKRAGNPKTYESPHRRFRDYHVDLLVRIVLRLESPDEKVPTLDKLAEALDWPARPIFLGRKPCLPSAPVLPKESDRWVFGQTAYEALCAVPAFGTESDECPALWPFGEGPETGGLVDRVAELADMRNWRTGLHGGARRVVEGRVRPAAT